MVGPYRARIRVGVTLALVVAAAGACRERAQTVPGSATAVAPHVSASAPAALSASAAPARLGPGAALQRRLAGLEVFVDAEPPRPMVVPAEVRRVLAELKDAVLESTDRLLSPALERPDPEAALEQALAAEGYVVAAQQAEPAALDVSLRPVPEHRERWGLTLCLALSPGTDCVLAVYERRRGALRRSLVVRSDLYESIEGALQALTWAASPPDERDAYYVVEAHTHPWLDSNFRKCWYRALAPSVDADAPVVLASGRDSARWTSGFRLEAEPDRFSVEFDVEADDSPAFEKPKRHAWVRRGERFVRR